MFETDLPWTITGDIMLVIFHRNTAKTNNKLFRNVLSIGLLLLPSRSSSSSSSSGSSSSSSSSSSFIPNRIQAMKDRIHE